MISTWQQSPLIWGINIKKKSDFTVLCFPYGKFIQDYCLTLRCCPVDPRPPPQSLAVQPHSLHLPEDPLPGGGRVAEWRVGTQLEVGAHGEGQRHTWWLCGNVCACISRDNVPQRRLYYDLGKSRQLILYLKYVLIFTYRSRHISMVLV